MLVFGGTKVSSGLESDQTMLVFLKDTSVQAPATKSPYCRFVTERLLRTLCLIM